MSPAKERLALADDQFELAKIMAASGDPRSLLFLGSVPNRLIEARRSLVASSTGLADNLALGYLEDAKAMLERANQEFALHGNSDLCRDYSYIAENKFELADAVARAALFRQTQAEAVGLVPSQGSEPARSSTGWPPAAVQ